MAQLDNLLTEVRRCTLCAGALTHGVRPVLQVSANAQILVAGQAPGSKVHASGVPFDDPSGDRLRDWMGIDRATFYDALQVAILPMGFCYPGAGKSGDLPPRPECAPKWRRAILDEMPNLKLTLVIGQFAARWHLGGIQQKNLTETVRNWPNYVANGYLPLPHPSPRNNIWLKKNLWFETEVLPELRAKVGAILR